MRDLIAEPSESFSVTFVVAHQSTQYTLVWRQQDGLRRFDVAPSDGASTGYIEFHSNFRKRNILTDAGSCNWTIVASGIADVDCAPESSDDDISAIMLLVSQTILYAEGSRERTADPILGLDTNCYSLQRTILTSASRLCLDSDGVPVLIESRDGTRLVAEKATRTSEPFSNAQNFKPITQHLGRGLSVRVSIGDLELPSAIVPRNP